MIDFVYNLHQVQKLDSGSPDQCPGQALPGMTNAQGLKKTKKRWSNDHLFSNSRFEEETSESRNPDRRRTTRTSRVRVTNYREVYFFKYSLMPAAARRPSPIAKMTVAAPSTMSPPA